jgi:hypothetical protein
MKKAFYSIVSVITLISLSSCGVVQGKGEAENIAESLFQERIFNGGFGPKEYYSDLFWKNSDEKKWSSVKNLVNRAMGNLLTYSLSSWKVQSKVHTNQVSGTFVVLVYETVYEKGNGTETLTIHKPVSGGEFAILGHHFNSEKIKELINKGIEQPASGEGV